MVHLSRKEDIPGLRVPDEEEERVVDDEPRARAQTLGYEHDAACPRRFAALLVDLDDRLVYYVVYEQVTRPGDARQVGLPLVEHLLGAQLGNGLLQFVRAFQLEPAGRR